MRLRTLVLAGIAAASFSAVSVLSPGQGRTSLGFLSLDAFLRYFLIPMLECGPRSTEGNGPFA
jgi:hypothetical protein